MSDGQPDWQEMARCLGNIEGQMQVQSQRIENLITHSVEVKECLPVLSKTIEDVEKRVDGHEKELSKVSKLTGETKAYEAGKAAGVAGMGGILGVFLTKLSEWFNL